MCIYQQNTKLYYTLINQIFQYPKKHFYQKKKKHFYISLTKLGFFYNYDYFPYFIHKKVFEVCFYATFLFLCFD